MSWTAFFVTIGVFCFGYMVVMTPVHMFRNARARAAAPDPTVDEHEAFPDDVVDETPARPHLSIVR